MNWLNLKELENKISTNNLTDKEGVDYLLANFIYGSVWSYIASINGLNLNSTINLLITLFVGIFILFKLYSLNNELDGKDFFKRYFAVTWVIRMKLLIVYFIFLFLYLALFDMKEKNQTAVIISLLFSVTISLIFCVMTIKSFKRLKVS